MSEVGASSDSFLRLLAQLERGSEDAATEVFERFAQRLLRLARARLDARIRSKVDPEDVLQSVFRSFFTRHAEGKFELRGWGSMWGVLTVLTVRRCYRESARHRAQRRDVTREVQPGGDADGDASWQPDDREPTPDEVAALADLVAQVMAGLSEREQTVLSLRLQGHTVVEIAAEVGRTERTVHRWLANIRERALRVGGL